MKKALLITVFNLGLATTGWATDLMDIYKQAVENDPIFKEAYATYMASAEAIPQARAALFPALNLSGQVGRYDENVVVSGVPTFSYYGSYVWQVAASQPIFNYQAWARVKQAKASVKAAQATFNNSAQELMLRTAKAYFDVLYAKDTLEFAEAKKIANKRQLDQATQRYKVGLDAITAVYEAQAGYDQSVAQVISAHNNQENQSENLRKLTNHVYEFISPLRNNQIPLIKPVPNDVNEWIDTGIRQNYKLLYAKYNMESSRENIKVATAGNWPVFSIQTNAMQTHNAIQDASFFVPGKTTTANVALAMNFPVFQGGLVQSQTRQAQYNFQAYSEKMKQAYQDVVVNSRIAFNTINDGISKVLADRQTLISQKNSLESTEAQYEVGTRTMVDVVNAQQRLFEAQEQLAQDQYNLINGILNLKYLAGTLNVNDIEQVNAWLATTRLNGLPPGVHPVSK